jgi:glycosyltransferase involved in cell wall biosynthesis
MIDNATLRETLRQRGLARARLFTWEACARQTLEVLLTVS